MRRLDSAESFTHLELRETFEIPVDKQDISELVSYFAEVQVEEQHIVRTAEGVNHANLHLSGRMLSLRLKSSQKIVYASKGTEPAMHVLQRDTWHGASMVIPKRIYGSDPEALLGRGVLRTEVDIRLHRVEKLGERSLGISLIYLIRMQVSAQPTLCIAEKRAEGGTLLTLAFENPAEKTAQLLFSTQKLRELRWSPCGQRLGIVSEESGKYNIGMVMPGFLRWRNLLPFGEFRKIQNLHWQRDGQKLCFAASVKEQMEIFVLERHKGNYRRLTFSNTYCINELPRFSEGETITFLRKERGKTAICTMHPSGAFIKIWESLTDIRDYDSFGVQSFVFAAAPKDSKVSRKNACLGDVIGDELYFLKQGDTKSFPLGMAHLGLFIKRIMTCPLRRYLAFVGKSKTREDIYLYDTMQSQLHCLTEAEAFCYIADFDWNYDGSRLYFTAARNHSMQLLGLCVKTKEMEVCGGGIGTVSLVSCRKHIV